MSQNIWGYRPYFKAMEWLKKNRGREVTTSIGGVMGAGEHVAEVIEYKQGKDYIDYIFQSTDKLLHKERVWDIRHHRYALGRKYRIVLAPGSDGSARIEAGGGDYKLIDTKTSTLIMSSELIRDLYTYVKDNGLKLVYLKIKYWEEIGDEQ